MLSMISTALLITGLIKSSGAVLITSGLFAIGASISYLANKISEKK